MSSVLPLRGATTIRALALAALALQVAGCVGPVGPAASSSPASGRASAVTLSALDVFRDVCGRVGEPEDGLARAVEARGFEPVRPANAAQFLYGRPGRAWMRGPSGEGVSVALQREGAECTVTIQRADIDFALDRFERHVLAQAGLGRGVRQTGDRQLVDEGRPIRQVAFRVTPVPPAAPVLYTFSGTSSPTADAQVFLRARTVQP